MNQSHLQAMVDGMNAQFQRERAETQMTLGGLLKALEELPDQTRKIHGIGKPNSYRGYYCDLAFEPTQDDVPVYALVEMLAQECMGRTFEGYKGGDYVMGELTPIWVARYGESGGLRITGLEVPEGKAPIMPILSPERF